MFAHGSQIRVEGRFGSFFVPSGAQGDSIVDAITRGDLFDWQIAEAMVRYFEPGSCFLDVGANFGQMSVAVAHALQQSPENLREGLGILIEAEPFVASIARANVVENGLQRALQVVEGAAWDKPGINLPSPP
jgi:hypothetical protein